MIGAGAGSAVGLEHVAVDPERALAEGLEIRHRAQAAADQALDLLGAARELAPRRLAIGARGRWSRAACEYSAVIQPRFLPCRKRGTLFSSRDGAQHLRASHLGQHRGQRILGEVELEPHRTQLAETAPVRASPLR